MEKIGVLVVTYNRLGLLKECIQSIWKQTYNDFQIIVVNNGSTDGTSEWLSSQEDIITLTQANLGGAGGFYTGMKYMAEHEYSYCWLMDDDVICETTALEKLLEGSRQKSNVGFVCSRVFGIDHQPMNMPVIDTRPSDNGYPDFLDEIDQGMLKVYSATFVSVLVPVSIIIELGLPYKEYFIWGDDTEYTSRISSKYDSYLVLSSKVIHKRKQTSALSIYTEKDKKRLRNYFYLYRNSAYTSFLRNKSLKKKLKIHLHFVYELIRAFSKGKFRALGIIMKAYFSLFNFTPKIVFPDKNN